MYAFVDAHRAAYGVEPICRVLQVAPSGYYEHRARAADPDRRPARARRAERLRADVRRVYRENHEVYGARKVWRQLRRDGEAMWRGFVYVAFVIDVFSRRIVGWRAHTTMRTELVLDALEQALHDREVDGRLVVHSDRGSQYVALRYPKRLAAAGAAPSVGSAGDAYDDALAESVIGLFKAEVIHRRGPWRGFEDVEYATLEWVAWFNT